MAFPTALFCNMIGMVLMNLFFLTEISWTITPYHLTGVLAGVLITFVLYIFYLVNKNTHT